MSEKTLGCEDCGKPFRDWELKVNGKPAHVCKRPSAPSQSLPPEPGKLEEDAEAYASQRDKRDEPRWQDLKLAFIAGARSRDALLASQGERIRELEKQLAEAASVRDDLALSALAELSGAGIPTPVEGYKDAPQFLPGDIQRLAKERDTLRAALEQVKAERDELKEFKAAAVLFMATCDCNCERYQGSSERSFICVRCRVLEMPALLAAGEKAGGEP